MRIVSRLPLNRWLPGTLWVEDQDGKVVVGPYACRGKADQQAATAHGNPTRAPWLPYGDHPAGGYRVVLVQHDKPTPQTFGPFFILLDPITGDALRGKQNGRQGIAIHGGDPTPDGGLRATKGCLRITNEAVTFLAALVSEPGTIYVCENAG